uniref:NTF2 domain-containing protein n=1 Tax=Arundo donax TaxID=35708 RepID=A0A0A9CV08_ARUDO
MAGQAGCPVNHPISPHVISGVFVQQYYHILHEQPEQVHKFYQDSSIIARPDPDGTMVSVTTLSDINKKNFVCGLQELLNSDRDCRCTVISQGWGADCCYWIIDFI